MTMSLVVLFLLAIDFFEPGYIARLMPAHALIIIILLAGILYRLDQIWSYYQRKIEESEQEEKSRPITTRAAKSPEDEATKERRMRKIYVGGLPHATTDARLQEIFSAHGTVESARVIRDNFTGRSRGFGFVEMASQEEAQKAIQALNGTDLDGYNLTVTSTHPNLPSED